jgi:hypothetical protein
MTANLRKLGGLSDDASIIGYDVVCPVGGVIERDVALQAGAQAIADAAPSGQAVVVPVLAAFRHRVVYVHPAQM